MLCSLSCYCPALTVVNRLAILLRLWHICFSLLDQAERAQAGDEGCACVFIRSKQHHCVARARRLDNKQPISRWMLELVPPPLDWSFWYQANWQVGQVQLPFQATVVSNSLVLHSCRCSST